MKARRIIALLVVLAMTIGLTNGVVFAAEPDLITDGTEQEPALLTEGQNEPVLIPDGIEESSPVYLTDELMETADALETEIDRLSECAPGDDYVEGSAFFLADTLEEAQLVASQYGAQVSSYSHGVAVITFDNKGTDEALREAADAIISHDGAASEELTGEPLSDLPSVPVYPIYLSHLDVYPENDPLYNDSNIAPKGQWFHRAINTPGAWAAGADGRGVRVAVIDSGIDTSNNDLHCEKVLYVEDSVFKKNPKYSDHIYDTGEDENGHGTHCAGIIAGLDNTVGGLGVAPGASIISIRASSADGELADSDIAMAIQMAIDNDVDVISMSFSGDHGNEAVNSKIRAAIDAGIVCIASAGNEGTESKSYPGGYEGVISVGAYNAEGTLSSFSNYGSWVTLAAPGSEIMSTMVGDPSAYMRKKNSFKDTFTDECSYGKLSGTSMAVPVVAGVAALVKSLHSSYSADRIKEVLVNSAPDKTYISGSHKVTGGIDAANAVTSLNPEPEDDPVNENEDYLYFGTGDEICVKAGRSVALGVCTSLNKKYPLSYSVSSISGMITVDKTGRLKVNKKAAAGDTAKVTVSCLNLSDTVNVTVIDKKTKSSGFALHAGNSLLSTKEDMGMNSTHIFMTGGDSDRPYRLVLTGKGTACFKSGGRELSVTSAYRTEEGWISEIYARKSGTATLTAYATDGSGYKASVKIRCISPLKTVKITYRNVPIKGTITMSQGSSLQLGAKAFNADNARLKDKVKYTWSGEYVKKGRVIAPKRETSFPVTVTAERNGFSAQETIMVRVSRKEKTVYMGYFYENSRGRYSYIRSVTLNKDSEGKPFSRGVSYRIETMPDLSGRQPKGARTNLMGPLAFTKKGNTPTGYDNSSNESGRYIVSVKGPSVKDIVYGDYGVRFFTPGKKGNYSITYTSLDGSGKTFTLNYKVSDR